MKIGQAIPPARPLPTRPNIWRKSSLTMILLAALAGCGGGSSDDNAINTGSSGTATGSSSAIDLSTQPEPKTPAEAVDLQYVRVTELRRVIAELQVGEEAALQDLIADRPQAWDRFWNIEYPDLLDKLEAASANLQQSESHIQTLVYGLPPATAGQVDTKFVPFPLVLAAIATVTTIVALEKDGYRERFSQRNEAQTRDLTEKLRQIYVSSGMDAGVADARAKIDAARVSVLWALERGIDSARWFVFENGLLPGLSSALSQGKQAAISLIGDLRNINTTRGNVELIMTTKSCRTNPPGAAKSLSASALDPERGATTPQITGKEVLGCRVYFCSTSSGDCANLPAGDWEAAVFAPGHLRDVDLDVIAPADGRAQVDAMALPATEIEPPPPIAQCSAVQNAGGDTADTRTVPLGGSSGTFSLSYQMYTIKDQIRVVYDGRTLFDSGCVSNSDTRLIPYAGLANFISVQVTPNCQGNTRGTAWNYRIACPSN